MLELLVFQVQRPFQSMWQCVLANVKRYLVDRSIRRAPQSQIGLSIPPCQKDFFSRVRYDLSFLTDMKFEVHRQAKKRGRKVPMLAGSWCERRQVSNSSRFFSGSSTFVRTVPRYSFRPDVGRRGIPRYQDLLLLVQEGTRVGPSRSLATNIVHHILRHRPDRSKDNLEFDILQFSLLASKIVNEFHLLSSFPVNPHRSPGQSSFLHEPDLHTTPS